MSPGAKYIFQARSKSVSGKTSAWSTAFDVTTQSDTIAPNPVTALTWEVSGTAFVATWVKPTTDSNGKTLKDLKDYKVTITAGAESVVYYVAQEKFDFSFEANLNSFGSPEPVLDIDVQARDIAGNLSTVVSDSATNSVPADVTNFAASGVNLAVVLTWDAVADDDLKAYEVYMETSGSGFTPGPTNLVYSGNATSFVLSSSSFVVHYFKVRAIDVFNQGSANYASASATPESSTGVDLTPPDDPTAVTVTTAPEADGSSSIEVTWTGVASSNLSDYLVRYSTDELSWRYVNVPGNQEEATISNLIPDTDYYVAVAAMSYSNIKSDFVNAGTYPITTATDTTAPSQPSEPTVSTTTLAAQISHDMTKEAGGDLEVDVAYLEVHASTTTGFTPSNTTLRGTIDTAGPGIDVSGIFYYAATDATANLYWKVIAVDRAKNKSTASNQSTGVPGLILNANIGNATITSAKINDLEANKITAGTGIINDLDVLSDLTIGTGGHVLSDNFSIGSETGWRLNEDGLVIYDGEIFAEALLLQDSQNLMPPQFADWEFTEEYYGVGFVNPDTMTAIGTGILIDIATAGARFRNQALQLVNAVITSPTKHQLVMSPTGLAATNLNIDVDPGIYIFSGYFKKNGTPNQTVALNVYTDASASITSSAFVVNSTSWTRFETLVTIPSGVSKIKTYLEFGPQAANTGYDFLVDGLQFERKITAETAASPFKPPSSTAIDGGSIVTGSIRSSVDSSTIVGQPAWSINTEGNMQIGDALVRGSIIIGDDDSENSFVRSAGYSAGVSGWTINADGFAEFNDVSLRGELVIFEGADEIIRAGKDEITDDPLVRVKTPSGNHLLKLFNFDDGGGTVRPSLYFYVDDGGSWDPSDGYIWYDQISDNGKGRMRLHAGGAFTATSDTDLHIIAGENSSGTGAHIWSNRVFKAGHPTTAGVAEVWHQMGLQAGWGHSQNVEYRLMPDGMVQFRGRASGGTTTAGTQINSSALPAAYRPPPGYNAACALAAGGTTGSPCSVEVTNAGLVLLRSTAPSIIHFDSLRYTTMA